MKGGEKKRRKTENFFAIIGKMGRKEKSSFEGGEKKSLAISRELGGRGNTGPLEAKKQTCAGSFFNGKTRRATLSRFQKKAFNISRRDQELVFPGAYRSPDQ